MHEEDMYWYEFLRCWGREYDYPYTLHVDQ